MRRRDRRGHALVLVAAILALLAIIATAYLTRTRGGRIVAVAAQHAAGRAIHHERLADDLAAEIAGALFVRPWPAPRSGNGVPGAVVSANVPRAAPEPGAQRYGVDPRAPYNHAPYAVIPFTNPPDAGLGAGGWARGEGAPFGVAGERTGNPLGSPGTADHRWLRSFEPFRGDSQPNGRDDVFRFWRHLSYIARAGNGYRLVRNLADVQGGGLVVDLDQPVEQWSGQVHPDVSLFSPVTGVAVHDDAFFARWQDWLGGGYAFAYRNPGRIPPNLYDLKDLDGDGIPHEPGEPPADAFVPGTPRWDVSRVLADTDGDGLTDAFWFLVPGVGVDGVRQLVAVSIVDNAARLNVVSATRFTPGPLPGVFEAAGTAGETPADLALTGEQLPFDGAAPSGWNVGFFDAPAHWEIAYDTPDALGGVHPLYDRGGADTLQIVWSPARWATWARTTGSLGGLFPDDPAALWTARERRRHWLAAGSRPRDPEFGLTPFTLADEIELRRHHGQNHPWAYTRLERAVNAESGPGANSNAFLRSSRHFTETSEWLDQLTPVELLHDKRRHLTTASAARHDEMPPWLRWRWRDQPLTGVREDLPAIVRAEITADVSDADGNGRTDVEDRFLAQTRQRLDLREGRNVAPALGERTFAERLPWTLLAALAEDASGGGRWYGDETGDTYDQSDADRVRRLAAAFSANILAYRDGDDETPLAEAVGLPEWDGVPADATTRYLGLERQPFLVEAFVGHVYHATDRIPVNPPPLAGYDGEGERYVDASSPQTSIVAVQIANPFANGGPLDLTGYELRVAGHAVTLTGILPVASDDTPASAVFYAIAPTFDDQPEHAPRWRDFLDLLPGEMPPGSLVVDTRTLPGGPWPTTRARYDDYDGDTPIELVRIDADTGDRIVVDRMDSRFAGPGAMAPALRTLPVPPPPGAEPLADPPVFNGLRLGEADHWITWVRVGRAWGYDVDFDPTRPRTFGVQSHERAPRFVFGDQRTSTPEAMQAGDPARGIVVAGDAFTLADDPDRPWFRVTHDSPAWRQALAHAGLGGAQAEPRRKPTFFTQHPVYDDAARDRYPDFDDPQFGYGRFLYGRSFPSDAPGLGVPDNGLTLFPASLQMLQKDADFQQVGELMYVWLRGHELDVSGVEITTRTTFAEHMQRSRARPGADLALVNRLEAGSVLGAGDPADLSDPRHAVPVLPAGHRVLDAFVCDGPGVNFQPGPPGYDDEDDFRFGNAMDFSGRATPGLINVNTASPEVLRTLPHWYRRVPVDAGVVPDRSGPRLRLPEAVISYRERYDSNESGLGFGPAGGPDFSNRGDTRDTLGVAAIGELLALDRSALVTTVDEADGTPIPVDAWRIDAAATGLNALSTDVIGPTDDPDGGDGVDGDVEARRLLFAGAANLLSVRSDVFTVHFRVRSFRPNPQTGVWDATDPEQIVDDTRYVMLVDRSGVERPDHAPRILFLEAIQP